MSRSLCNSCRLWAGVPQTIISQIRPGRGVVGPVALSAVGRISSVASHYVAGIPAIIVIVIRIGVVVIGIIAISIAQPDAEPESRPEATSEAAIAAEIATESAISKLSATSAEALRKATAAASGKIATRRDLPRTNVRLSTAHRAPAESRTAACACAASHAAAAHAGAAAHMRAAAPTTAATSMLG